MRGVAHPEKGDNEGVRSLTCCVALIWFREHRCWGVELALGSKWDLPPVALRQPESGAHGGEYETEVFGTADMYRRD